MNVNVVLYICLSFKVAPCEATCVSCDLNFHGDSLATAGVHLSLFL